MRIVHDVDRPFQSGGALIPYAVRPGCDKSNGFRVELILTPRIKYPDDPYAAIYIDGNAKHVLALLRETVEMIEEGASGLIANGKLVHDWRKRDE